MRVLITFLFLLIGEFLFAQNLASFSGKVVDQNNDPMIQASVFFVGTNLAAVTDENGEFVIQDIEFGIYDLKVTYIGFRSYSEKLKIYGNENKTIALIGQIFGMDEIEIKSYRVDESDPFTYQTIDQSQIEKNDFAQDIPILLRHTTNAVATSDAGNGVGYTGLRIRGSDASRTNVSINGVPLNDAESQSVFWVNMPDFSSSVKSIQIQRGAGTSAAGVGAFGANVSFQTKDIKMRPYLKVGTLYGSFNTQKYNVKLGTGLMNDKVAIDFRYSKMLSDGYIDRASSDLNSIYFSLNKVSEKSLLTFTYLKGSERTYQSWYGSPKARVEADDDSLLAHYNNNLGFIYQTVQDSINLFSSDRRYNYYLYENQVDDYNQTHYQLHYDRNLSTKLIFNSTIHYTRGIGFFEQFRNQEDLLSHGVSPQEDPNTGDLITESDLVRRRWLDNHYFGGLVSLKYEQEKFDLIIGSGGHHYIGDHYGKLVGVQDSVFFDVTNKFYDNRGEKFDYNLYSKFNYRINGPLQLNAEIQLRGINYKVKGIDIDARNLVVDTSMLFINPKFGISYQLNSKNQFYASLGIANREPDRNDFIDALENKKPKHESLLDYELGYRFANENFAINTNMYYMDYQNQLVLNGQLNDVGSTVRVNVDNSYRLGLELELKANLGNHLHISPNLSWSKNKISSFTEVVYDYTNGFDIIENIFENTDISFSPNIVIGNAFGFNTNGFEVGLLSKFVSRQYLDNTQNEYRSIDPYFVNDLILAYSFEDKWVKKINFSLAINNLLNMQYSANGYAYSSISGAIIEEVFLYPQAGINLLFKTTLDF